MGTKQHPGRFNCHAAALPDEEIFTVLARDPAMPATIRFWIAERARLGKAETGEDQQRLADATEIADNAAEWREANLNGPNDRPTWKDAPPRPSSIRDMDDRPVRMMPNEPEMGYNADAQGQPVLVKISLGLRQVTEEMQRVINSTTWPDTRKRQMLTFCDRINGYATEAGEVAGKGVFHSTLDLATPPEIPDHRFASFYKGEHYAYARGLEVNPTHLPVVLDRMAADGYHLLAVFGVTDSKNVGFIFRRDRGPVWSSPYRAMPDSSRRTEPFVDRWDEVVNQDAAFVRHSVDVGPVDEPEPLDDKSLFAIAGSMGESLRTFYRGDLGEPYMPPAEADDFSGGTESFTGGTVALGAACDEIVLENSPSPAHVAGQPFLSALAPLTRVNVLMTALWDRGEDCRRYVNAVLAAEHVSTRPTDEPVVLFKPRSLGEVMDDAHLLGRIAARLEQAFWDDAICDGIGRGLLP